MSGILVLTVVVVIDSALPRALIETAMPTEVAFLQAYDKFQNRLMTIVDMPNQKSDLLLHFLHQNGGILSKMAKEKEFVGLTAKEIVQIERIYVEVFFGQLATNLQ